MTHLRTSSFFRALSWLSIVAWLPSCASPQQSVPYGQPIREAHHCGVTDGKQAGLAQSPINLSSTQVAGGSHTVAFAFQPSGEHVLHKGTTIELEYDEGSSVSFDGISYDLRQFHFHTPSEHLVDGVTYPLECHLVHTGPEPDTYLVIGVLFKEGEANTFLEEFLDDVPLVEGGAFEGEHVIDVRDLLQGDLEFLTYQGSLTTPPYTESVRWLVLKTVRVATRAQIARIHNLEGDNARHVQERAGRIIEGS